MPLYHATYPAPPASIAEGLHNVSPEDFHEHLHWLSKRVRIVSLDEFADSPSPEGIAAITFDDAYSSVFEFVAPILSDLGIPFTVFVNSDTAQGRVLWRDLVRVIANANMIEQFERWSGNRYKLPNMDFYRYTKHPKNNSENVHSDLKRFVRECMPDAIIDHHIQTAENLSQYETAYLGNHSHRHYVLSSLPDEVQHEEIERTDLFLKRVSPSSRCTAFAVPFGNDGTYNETTFRILSDLGYSTVVLSRHRLHCRTERRYGLKIIERFMPLAGSLARQIRQLQHEMTMSP